MVKNTILIFHSLLSADDVDIVLETLRNIFFFYSHIPISLFMKYIERLLLLLCWLQHVKYYIS